MGKQRCCSLAPCRRCRAAHCRWRQRTAGIRHYRQDHRGIAMVSMRLPQMRAFPWTLWAPRLSWGSRYSTPRRHTRHIPGQTDDLCLVSPGWRFPDFVPMCSGNCSGAQVAALTVQHDAAQDAKANCTPWVTFPRLACSCSRSATSRQYFGACCFQLPGLVGLQHLEVKPLYLERKAELAVLCRSSCTCVCRT